MTETSPQRVTILEDDAYWTKNCIKALEGVGVNAVQQDPSLDLLKKEEVKHNLFVLRANNDQSKRFDLVKQISEYGGMSLVIATSRDTAWEIRMKCLSLGRASSIGPYGDWDFDKLIEVTKAILKL